jgi:peptidoglycan/LPS O-acetylase OafA/YrhL
MNKSRRKDIDVLRAISVVSVIVFHLDKSFFPLGYLGVDIFFVISGYLITKIIIKELKNKNFSFKNFYLRRAKRILPAFLVVLFSTLGVAFFFLLTADLKAFTESLLASLGFFPNIYFWITGGYFSSSDELKPLLHLWSLGVEEQFYLFFPIVFFLIFKKFSKLNNKIFFILIIVFFSYFINIFFINKGHLDPNFFLFPARIWQFGLGVIAAMLPLLKLKDNKHRSYIIYFASILILLNFYRILPVLPHATLISFGTALILYVKIDKNNFLFKLINFKILIFTGLISYSLYLWHWPIISLIKYVNLSNLNLTHILISLTTTYLLASLTWKFIEQPCLKNKKTNIGFLNFILFSYLLLIIASLTILFNKNLPSRYEKFPNKIAEAVGSTYHCSILDYRKFGDSYACIVNDLVSTEPEVVLFGNSHAHMYGWGFKEALIKTGKQGLTIPLNSCLPTIDKNISRSCLVKTKKYFDEIIENKKIKTVIIGLTWNSTTLVDENQNKHSGFKKRNESLFYTINRLKKNNKKVFLIGPIEIPGFKISSIVSRELAFKKETSKNFSSSREKFDKKYKDSIKFFRKKMGRNFLETYNSICNLKNCYFVDNNGSNFSDSNHLSSYGSKKMAKYFLSIFE